jgi:hypothetical protein
MFAPKRIKIMTEINQFFCKEIKKLLENNIIRIGFCSLSFFIIRTTINLNQRKDLLDFQDNFSFPVSLDRTLFILNQIYEQD